MKINQMAKEYVSPETKNISELEIVPVDLDIKVDVVNEGTPEEFKVNKITINEEEYRVPNSVLKQLKLLLEDDPNMEAFKVLKDGEGMKTTYQVVKV